MITKIDNKKQARYTGLNNARSLLDELEQAQHSEGMSFKKAEEAIQFLKVHNEDNEFEREASTTAIIKAIDYLEKFEKELLELMIEGMAEDERQKELSKIAHGEALKTINSKIKPSLEKLLSDIESLNAINNYCNSWFEYELEGFIDQVKKATRV